MSLPKKSSGVRVRGRLQSNGKLPLVARDTRRTFMSEEGRLDRKVRHAKRAVGRLFAVEKDVKLPSIIPRKNGSTHVKSGKYGKTEITSRNNDQSIYRRPGARLTSSTRVTSSKRVLNTRVKNSDKIYRSLKRDQITRLSDSLGILRLNDEVQTYNFCVREASLDIRRIELSPRGGSSRANKPLRRLGKEGYRDSHVLPPLPKEWGNPAEMSLFKNTEERYAKSEAKLSQGAQRSGRSLTPLYPNFDLTPLEERSLGNLTPTSLDSSVESLDGWQQDSESQLLRFSPSPPGLEYLDSGADPRPAFPTLHVTSMTSSASNMASSPCFSDESFDSFFEEVYALSPLPPSELSSQSELSVNFYNHQDKQHDTL